MLVVLSDPERAELLERLARFEEALAERDAFIEVLTRRIAELEALLSRRIRVRRRGRRRQMGRSSRRRSRGGSLRVVASSHVFNAFFLGEDHLHHLGGRPELRVNMRVEVWLHPHDPIGSRVLDDLADQAQQVFRRTQGAIDRRKGALELGKGRETAWVGHLVPGLSGQIHEGYQPHGAQQVQVQFSLRQGVEVTIRHRVTLRAAGHSMKNWWRSLSKQVNVLVRRLEW
jgi:hypothetical protein